MNERINSAEELEVYEEVGRGGFGVVYRGIVKSNETEVAIKQIDLENDQTDLLEINKEIQIISDCRLSQITKYYGCFVRHYKLWVIMEYVNGGSLFDLLKSGAINDERTILGIIREVLVALEYLHTQGKIHRDLKSQNVLVSSLGEIKLTDFGVSTQLASNFSRRNTTVGTPYWMAPEVILNNNGGHSYKADIWSLGCLAYELFTGKPPLQNQYSPMQALRQISKCYTDNTFIDIIDLEHLGLSSNFSQFLRKCFIVDPSERYSATKLLKQAFITKSNNKSANSHIAKSLKKLITRKKLWDQDHHVLKPHNWYIPTEAFQNQKYWQNEDVDSEKTIHFDISLLESPAPSKYPLSPTSSKTSSNRDTSESPLALPDQRPPLRYNSILNHSSKGDDFKQYVKTDLRRILNKVFNKIESKNNLSTEQYDLLVTMNDIVLSLVSNLQTEQQGSTPQVKLLVCQYFKYFLKELSKPNVSKSRISLAKLIVPSCYSVNKTKDETALNTLRTRYQSGIDEIEHSLFESWIDKMKEKWDRP
ncbi:uncharacterized protein PRCAT00002283001 [Priceomyces carsonii]|uniref:uncharacterized protein n=1 Tax=Priceomyces carsonii TaxID=28549 RepID=UPI002ED98B7B|nr:unnamed protein product [Priceomyces carsonii]